MMNFCLRGLLTLLVALSLAREASAQVKTISVVWDFNVSEVVNATVGDTIEFSWPRSGFHDVYIHPTGTCDPEGAIEVYAPPTPGGFASYTFRPGDGAPDGKPVFFACQVGEGVHCNFNVNQTVIVFTPDDTDEPTPAPSVQPSTNEPSASPTTSFPSASPSTPFPSTQPSPEPSASPTNPAPSAMPSTPEPTAATESPSEEPTTTPSAAPSKGPTTTPSASPSSSPTNSPSQQPSEEPIPTSSPSDSPSKVPQPGLTAKPTSGSPSASPSFESASPTNPEVTENFINLQMTLFGIDGLSEEEIEEWQSVTAQYQVAFYSLNEQTYGLRNLFVEMDVTGTRTSRRLQETTAAETSVTLTYNQIMTYEPVESTTTPESLAARPFATETVREQYLNIYFKDSIARLQNISSSTVVTMATFPSLTSAPTVSPIEPVAPSQPPASEIIDPEEDEDDGLSNGAIFGIAAAGILFLVMITMFFVAPRLRSSPAEPEAEENPYIPPGDMGDQFGVVEA